MDLLTSSRLKAARACPRLHQIRYVEGWRSTVEADALRFGTLIHRGLEAWWRATDNRLDAALAAMAGGEADPYDTVRAAAMIVGYDTRWGAEPYDVLAVEQEFRAPLVNPESGAASRTFALGGKIDAIVRDQRDGRVLVVEHKSSSEGIGPGSAYWTRLTMDSQISIYYAGACALGYDVAGCLYDVLGKPALRPLNATPPEARKYTKAGALYAAQRDRDETPEEHGARVAEDIAANPTAYYQRGVVVRLDGEVAEAALDVWQVGRAIRENALAGRAPRNPDACKSWGRMCEFWPVCSGQASLDDPIRFTRNANVHPELSEVAAPISKEEIAT